MFKRLLFGAATLTAALTLTGGPALAGSGTNWLHIRVVEANGDGETVRVNIPLSMVEKVLPTIAAESDDSDALQMKDGTIKLGALNRVNGSTGSNLDLRTLWEAFKETGNAEFVRVESKNEKVRVARDGDYFVVHVDGQKLVGGPDDADDDDDDDADTTATARPKAAPAAGVMQAERVDLRIPLDVIEALFSGNKDELNLSAALAVLQKHSGEDLITVEDGNDHVRIWVDSKNSAD